MEFDIHINGQTKSIKSFDHANSGFLFGIQWSIISYQNNITGQFRVAAKLNAAWASPGFQM